MKNLYLLPTGKESKLFENVDNGTFAFSKEAIRWRGEQFLNYHLYIISDEIPTEGDALMRTDISRVFCTLKGANPSIVQKYCRKIILTTDPSLVGVQQIDEEFLKWFVQNPKREWVEVKKDYLAGYYIPQKQETLEEAAKNYSIGWGQCDDKKAFIAGAKWQQERDYELIDRYVDDVMGGCNLKFKDWVNR